MILQYTKETGNEMNNDFSTASESRLSGNPVFPQDGWNPLTGRREFRSANQAWDMYGQYRFGIAKRTFLNYVGKEKRCRPRPDMTYHVEDIEKFSISEGWPPAPAFARLAPQGKRGGSADATCYGEMYQMEKALTQRAVRQAKELEVDRKLKRLIPRELYEQSLAAAAVVTSTGLEAFVYDSVREIIHLCGGTLEKEDALREYMLERVKDCLNGFSEAFEYDVELEARLDEEAEKEAPRGDAQTDREADA